MNREEVKLGKNFRGKALARRIFPGHIHIKQGRHTVILTETQVRKSLRAFK